MTTPNTLAPASLAQIQHSIQELETMRAEALTNGAALIAEVRAGNNAFLIPQIELEMQQAVAVIDQQIAEWSSQQIQGKKIDGICKWLRETRNCGTEALAESKRLKAHADAWESRHDRMKAYVLETMQRFDVKRIESATNVLRIQGNGGLQPLETGDALPTEYRLVTVTMREQDWIKIAEHVPYATDVKVSPDNFTIRRDLGQKIVCPECKNHRGVPGDDPNPGSSCPRCKGEGTIPANIPGAKLLPRSSRLVVE